MNRKVKAARLSIFSNISLIILKVFAGLYSGSVSIISEAIHSAMDLLASFIAYFSLRVADTPADKEHPYGHGKYENISGVLEAILIFVAAIWIMFEAVEKIKHPSGVEMIGLGALVMLISAGVNFFVSRKLYKVAKEEDSIALEADALHLKTDVYTSLGVAIALLLIWLTNITILDPIVAILVALMIIKESYVLLKNAFQPLLDMSLSDSEIDTIKEVLHTHKVNYHDLRTRKSGAYRFADLHLELPPDMIIANAHALCDMIEDEIKIRIRNLELNIHIEPIN